MLFVCMGNICRSPTAHALFREAVTAAGLDEQIAVDSAGTHAYHIGNPPMQGDGDGACRGYRYDGSARAAGLRGRFCAV
ncbi:MAG: hypothetical protein CM15mP74_29920 [Halieaceae bacterium]|nr:MAG: hypothetical protein CM15mP74_29920 [Halieaceae bacterium]